MTGPVTGEVLEPIPPRTTLAAQAAQQVEDRLRQTLQMQRALWVTLAEDLHKFSRQRLWADLGHPSFESWLAGPDIDLERRWVYELISIWEQLVVKRDVKPEQLAPVQVSKIREVLPGVRRGEVTVEEALSDAEVLPREDLRAKYTGVQSPTPGRVDNGTAVNTASEARFAICHACGSRYPVQEQAA